jgi:hypothetical protein
MKNYQLILTCGASFTSMYLIMNGVAQKYVHFADPLNEMFTAGICGMMGILSLAAIDYKAIWNAFVNK